MDKKTKEEKAGVKEYRKMRPADEIEMEFITKSVNKYDKEKKLYSLVSPTVENQRLELEVLLDIRELLMNILTVGQMK